MDSEAEHLRLNSTWDEGVRMGRVADVHRVAVYVLHLVEHGPVDLAAGVHDALHRERPIVRRTTLCLRRVCSVPPGAPRDTLASALIVLCGDAVRRLAGQPRHGDPERLQRYRTLEEVGVAPRELGIGLVKGVGEAHQRQDRGDGVAVAVLPVSRREQERSRAGDGPRVVLKRRVVVRALAVGHVEAEGQRAVVAVEAQRPVALLGCVTP
eukprot:scaffold8461_cov68-Phaeocystis_antarctica.AAC.5